MENGALKKDHEDEPETRCGLLQWRPSALQRCGNIAVFSGIFSFLLMAHSIIFTYAAAVITTIEKRFKLSSQQSGFILSSQEIGHIVCIATMTHFLSGFSRPKVLTIVSIVSSVGIFFLALPHFLYGAGAPLGSPTNVTGAVQNSSELEPQHRLCVAKLPTLLNYSSLDSAFFINGSVTLLLPGPTTDATTAPECGENTESQSAEGINAYRILVIMMVFQAFAFGPTDPMGMAYVDDNVDKNKGPTYISAITAVWQIGPVIGFAIGSLVTSLYVTLGETNLTPDDEGWVGAWWIGFVVNAILGIIVSIPMLCFPPSLKKKRADDTKHQDDPTPLMGGNERNQNADDHKNEHEHHEVEEVLAKATSKVKDFPKAVFRLVTNMAYVTLTLGFAFEMYLYSGYGAFMPKYMETQFHISATKANAYMTGFMAVMTVGLFLSGVLITKLKIGDNPGKLALMILITNVISAIVLILGMVFGCDQSTMQLDSNLAGCGAGCDCSDVPFNPVCGSDNVMYFSSCHAGCVNGSDTQLSSCHCILSGNQTALPGPCPTECPMYIPFIILVAVGSFMNMFTFTPWLTILMRIVSVKDKPFAIGISSATASLLSLIPAPIIYGAVIDSTCLTWEESDCGQPGYCLLYSSRQFRYSFHGLTLAAKALSLLFYGILTWKCRAMKFHSHGTTDNKLALKDKNKNGDVEMEDVKMLPNNV